MKNPFFALVAFVQIAFLLSTPYFAADAGRTSSGRKAGFQVIRGFLGNDVGLTPDDYFQGVATQKQAIPEVSVSFTQTDGKNYTAIAQVSGLRNINDAYYTWYLKNDSFDRTNRALPPGQTAAFPRSKYMGAPGEPQNLSHLSELERIERYKIAAVRAHIDSKFDYLRFDSEFNNNDIDGNGGGTVGDGDGYLEESAGLREFPDVDNDNDGYVAYVGGDNAKNGLESVSSNGVLEYDSDNYCYLYNRTLGDEYELVDNSESVGGFSCGESDKKYDVGGSSARWDIECWEEEVAVDSCPVYITTEITNSTTATGGETTNIDDGTTATTDASGGTVTNEVTISQDSAATGRTLYDCSRSESSAICLSSDVPSVALPSSFGGTQYGTGRGRCFDGGVPVCVPIPEKGASEIDPSDGGDATNYILRQQYQDYLDYRESVALKCFVPNTNPSDIRELIRLRDAWQGAVDTTGSVDSPEAQEARLPLDTALGVFLDEGEIENFDLTTLESLLLEDTGDDLVDPNSFLCAQETSAEDLPNLPIHDAHKEAFNVLNLNGSGVGAIPAQCDQPTCINRPDYEDNDLESDGFYSGSCDRKTQCNRFIHLFPNSFGAQAETDIVPGDFVTGDGVFSLAEEEFWGTNPLNASSVDADLNDEMVVVGKGLMEFNWEYREGDEIGVVVEGIGINATRHDSQHPQTVFAFMKDGCEPDAIESYFESIRTRDNVEFETANMDHSDLSECLLDNFVSPGNVTENQNFEVDLSGPTRNVVNNRHIPIFFEVGLVDEQATDAQYDAEKIALYNWKIDYAPVQGGVDPGADDQLWQPYLNFAQTNLPDTAVYRNRIEALGLTEIKGVGLNELAFQADFTEGGLAQGEAYNIRVTVEVNAPTRDPGITRFGRSSHIFTITNQGRPQLDMGRVNLVGDDEPFVADETKITPICREGGIGTVDDTLEYNILCPTIENELITLEIPPIVDASGNVIFQYPPETVSWELDGRRISCDPSVSDLCTQKAIIFIPTREADTIHTVTATYVDPSKGTGAVEEFSRSFSVVQPEVFIERFEDTLLEREEGEFLSLGLEGEASSYVSDDITSQYILAVEDSSTFQTQVRFEPSMLDDYIGGTDSTSTSTDNRVTLRWSGPGLDVDSLLGEIETDANHSFVIPDHLVGEPVTVALNAIITTPIPIQKILADKFGISQFKSGPLYASTAAEIHPFGTPVEVSLSKPEYRRFVEANRTRNQTVFATVFTNTSSYVLLILKLVLTIGIILFISSVAMPPRQRSEY